MYRVYIPSCMYDIFIYSFNLIYDFSTFFSFSSCQRHIHFASVKLSLSLRAINLSLNYHSRDKLRGPPQAHDWSSLHYHYLVTPSGPWLLVNPIVSGRRWRGERNAHSPKPHRILRSTLSHFLPAFTILLTLSTSSLAHSPSFFWPLPHRPPFLYRFIWFVKVKVFILNGLLIRHLYWTRQGAEAWSIPVAIGAWILCYIPQQLIVKTKLCLATCLRCFIGKGTVLFHWPQNR